MRVSVQVKLLAAFGIVVALMLGVGLFGIARLASDNQHLSRLASKVVPATRAVGDVNALMNKYRKDQLHYIVALPADRPLSAEGSIEGDLAEDLALMSHYLHAYRSEGLIEDPTDRRLLETFQSDFARYVKLTASFASLANHGQVLKAGEVVGNGAGDAEYDKLKEVIAAWSGHEISTAKSAEKASGSSYDLSVRLILALLMVAVAIAIAVAVAFARRTTRAVREIGNAAKAIAEGDIDQRVDVRSRDEFGEMAKDFDSMIGYLRSTVGVAETIAQGNLKIQVRPRSERDALGNSLVAMTDSLRRLVDENEHLLAASQKEANTDALTALPNRRALMHDLETLLAEGIEETPAILALFDLNGFKQYNDTFGHPAGDALLTRVGDRLQRALGVGGRLPDGRGRVLRARRGRATAARDRSPAADALAEQGEALRSTAATASRTSRRSHLGGGGAALGRPAHVRGKGRPASSASRQTHRRAVEAAQ